MATAVVGLGLTTVGAAGAGAVDGLVVSSPTFVTTADGAGTVALSVAAPADAATLRIVAEGAAVVSAQCTADAADVAVDTVAGAATVLSPVAAGAAIGCRLDVAPAASGSTGPLSITGRDAFGQDAWTRSATTEYRVVTVTARETSRTAAGQPFASDRPLRIGDVVGRSVLVSSDPPVALQPAPAAGAAVSCSPATESTYECETSRTLTASDLASGSIPLGISLVAGETTVISDDTEVVVFAENRAEMTLVAGASSAAVGETVELTLTLSNAGTTELTGGVLALGSLADDLTAARCGGVDPAEPLTLAPAATVTCAWTHRVSAADADHAPLSFRAEAPFGSDGDGSNDDPTSATDVDTAVTTAVFSVNSAGVTTALAFSPAIFVVGAGSDIAPPLQVTVRSTGALAGVSAIVPLEPIAGVTLVGCAVEDLLPEKRCRIPLADLAAGGEQTAAVSYRVVNPPPGTMAVDVAVRIVAAGGIDQDAGTASLTLAGLSVTSEPTFHDAGDSTTAIVPLFLAALPHAPLTVALGLPTPSCETAAGETHPVSTLADGTGEIRLAGGDEVRCDVEWDVDGDAVRAGGTGFSHTVTARTAAGSFDAEVEGFVALARLDVPAPTSPVTPVNGYRTADGPTDRPDRFEVEVEVAVEGGGPNGDGVDEVEVAAAGSNTSVACQAVTADPDGDGQPAPAARCTVTHAVTAADLARGYAEVTLTSTALLPAPFGEEVPLGLALADPFADQSLQTTTVFRVPTPHQHLAVGIAELSAPASVDGYGYGDGVRWLVTVTNDGTLPLDLDAVALGGPGRTAAGTPAGCGLPRRLLPGESIECSAAVGVDAIDVGNGAATLAAQVTSVQGVAASATASVPVRPGQPQPPTAPPSTGAGSAGPAGPATGDGGTSPGSAPGVLVRTGAARTRPLLKFGIGLLLAGALALITAPPTLARTGSDHS